MLFLFVLNLINKLIKYFFMKQFCILLLLVFASHYNYSQEICNNAKDDDGDGLIDLNDPECKCVGNIVNVPSLIPNSSFEDKNCCPKTLSQLSCADTWIQATTATSDYFNCGYTWTSISKTSLVNYPDGSAIVGAFYVNGWKEYVGAKLLAPMKSGTLYKLKLKIGSTIADGNGNYVPKPKFFSPVNVTLFGCANGKNLPVLTKNSPNLADPTWKELGHATYTPNAVWSDLEIDFTPTYDINAIMIGPPEKLPKDYPIQGSSILPYFVYDQLTLNKSDAFDFSNTITSTGDFCNNNVALQTSNTDAGLNYQWYDNGIAILNATASTLQIKTYSPQSTYSLKLTNDKVCSVSNALKLNSLKPEPPIVSSPPNYCKNDTVLPLNAIGSNLLWYSSLTGGTGDSTTPIVSTAVAGNFDYYVSQTCGIESDRAAIKVVVNNPIIPNFPLVPTICFGTNPPLLNSASPNGVLGTWSPNSIDNEQNGVYIFQPGTGICAEKQTLNISVSPQIDFHLIGGCNYGNYEVQAISDTNNFDLKTLTFEWQDPKGNKIGKNEPQLNVTNLVDSTTEIEVFPLTYSLKISDSNDCVYIKSIEIEKIFCDIPKGISPNNDGKNDFFDLRGLNVTHLQIFNRYGEKVFDQNDYTIEWKGQSNSGQILPDGVYFYNIENKKGEIKTGWVTINQ